MGKCHCLSLFWEIKIWDKKSDIKILVDLVRHDLTWSGQFELSVEDLEKIPD